MLLLCVMLYQVIVALLTSLLKILQAIVSGGVCHDLSSSLSTFVLYYYQMMCSSSDGGELRSTSRSRPLYSMARYGSATQGCIEDVLDGGLRVDRTGMKSH